MKTMRIATLAGLAMIAAGSAFAADVTINITGNVQDTTCQVNGKKVETLAVALRTVTSNVLSEEGKVEAFKREDLKITGCESAFNKVTATFEPLNVNSNGRLNNTATGGATNVDIQVLNGETKAVMNLNTTPTVDFDVKDGSVTIPLGFQYYATGQATQGAVTSQLLVGLTYK